MIPTFWQERTAGIAFPGRARVVGALAGATDHGDAGQVEALWLAAGAALAESRRGGLVVTAVADPDAAWWQAAVAIPRLGPLPLVLVAAPGVDRAWLAAYGWTQVVEGVWPGQVSPSQRQEWTPVQLPTIPMGNLPPWPRDPAAAPRHQVLAALVWLAEREPAMWVGGGPGALMDAHLAGEGRRAVSIAAPGQAPDALVLARAGRLQLPLKLVCDAVALPAEPPPGWWIARPRDGGECAAALAWILNDESPWLLALPPVFPAVDAWPAGQAWEPPSG
jgi:hypothetical protein